VLEIGTLGGYGTIWLGPALGPGGRVVGGRAAVRRRRGG
jgi:predicted O-methyltransferase YrrM